MSVPRAHPRRDPSRSHRRERAILNRASARRTTRLVTPGPRPHLAAVLRKFLIYGFAGWVVEVLFTGAFSAVKKDRAATAKTYLWMHPIYGLTALGMEWLSNRLRPLPWPVRGLAYTAAIYGAEYSSGWMLKKFLGKCPWDYSGCGRDVHGLVRLDYAPAWYALGLLFEPLRDTIDATSPSQKSVLAPLKWPRMPGRRRKTFAQRVFAM